MLTTKKWAMTFGALWVAALCGLLLCGCVPAGPRALLAGERLIQKGEYALAIKKLKLATRLLPQNAQAWNHLGLAYHGAGQWEDAFHSYQKALNLNRDLAVVHFNLGCLWLELNQPAAAATNLTTYVILQPGSAEGWLKLGTAQLRARSIIAAEQSLNRCLALQPNNTEALNGLGLVNCQRNRFREAYHFFSLALQQKNPFVPALLNQAVLLHQQLSNRPAALQKYRDYLALIPAPPNAADVQEVARQLAWELQPPVPVPPSNGLALVKSTNLPSIVTNAVQRLASASTTAPPIVPVPKPVPTNRVPIATAPLPPATEARPSIAATSPPPRPATAPPPVRSETPTPAPPPASSTQSGTDQAKAEPDSNRAESITPNTKPPEPATQPSPLPIVQNLVREPTNTTASVATQLPPPRLLAAAAPPTGISVTNTALVPATVHKPEKPGLFQRLNPARLFSRRTKPPPPTPLTPKSSTTNIAPVIVPTSPVPAMVASAGSSPMPAQTTVTPLLPRPAPKRYTYHSLIRPVAGNRAEAEPFFNRGVEHQREGRLAPAIEAYRQAIRLDPAYLEAAYNLGVAATAAGDMTLALAAYEQALAAQPNAAQARYNFGLALLTAHYPQDAAVELEKVLLDNPDDVRTHLALGNLYAQELYQNKLAGAHYRRVLELDPQHPQADAIRFWIANNP